MRRWKPAGGSAVLEFALGFTLLWTMLAGVFQFGYPLYVYNALNNAVTDGAAFASRADFDANATSAFSTQVKNMAVYGSPAGGGQALVPGLTTAQVSVAWTVDTEGLPQTVTVRIVNFPVYAVFKSFTFTNKPVCTVRFAGRFLT
jgi:Flp pilus assembly protein TadG